MMFFYKLACGCIFEDSAPYSIGDIVTCEFLYTCPSNGVQNQKILAEWNNSDYYGVRKD